MASKVRNLLKLQGSQGLAETSTEELAKQTGRAGAPTAPLETGVIGGNEHQAKMAGTPNQTVSALRQTLREPEMLSTRMRQTQPTRSASAEEQAKLEKQTTMEKLGSLDSRVQSMVESKLAAPGEQVDLLANIEDPDVRVLANPNATPDQINTAVSNINKKEGRDLTNSLTADEILSQYGLKDVGIEAASDIAAGYTQSLEDLGVTDEDFASMGFSGANEVADLLGMSPEELAGMSYEDFANTIQQEIDNEYSQVENLQALLNDPNLGPAERADIRAQLKELGAVGIRSAESEAEQLAQDIQEATTVEIMGEEMTVNDMLNSDFVSGLIANYLTDPDSESANKLKEEMPGLVDYIDSHKESLSAAATEISNNIKENAAIQQDNLLTGTFGEAKLDNNVMKKIFPDWGQSRGQRYDKSTSPLLSYIDTAEPARQSAIINNINSLVQKSPELAEQLATLSPNDMDKLGITSMNNSDIKELGDYLDTKERFKKFGFIDDERELSNFLFPDRNPDEAMAELKEVIKKVRSGLIPGDELPFDLDFNGNIDFSALNRKLKYGYSQERNLSNLANSGIPESISGISAKISQYKNANTPEYEVYNRFAGDDGILDKNDVRNMAQTATFDDIDKVLNSDAFNKNVPRNLRRVLARKAIDTVTPEIDSDISGSSNGDFSSTKHMLNSFSVTNPDNFKFGVENPGHVGRINDAADNVIIRLQAKINGATSPLRRKIYEQKLEEITNKKDTYNTKVNTRRRQIEEAKQAKVREQLRQAQQYSEGFRSEEFDTEGM